MSEGEETENIWDSDFHGVKICRVTDFSVTPRKTAQRWSVFLLLAQLSVTPPNKAI